MAENYGGGGGHSRGQAHFILQLGALSSEPHVAHHTQAKPLTIFQHGFSNDECWWCAPLAVLHQHFDLVHEVLAGEAPSAADVQLGGQQTKVQHVVEFYSMVEQEDALVMEKVSETGVQLNEGEATTLELRRVLCGQAVCVLVLFQNDLQGRSHLEKGLDLLMLLVMVVHQF